MKYYYLNCNSQKREIIKRKIKPQLENAPYRILDTLKGCDEMIVVGKITPDMEKLQELARRMEISIRHIEVDMDKDTRSKSKARDYHIDY